MDIVFTIYLEVDPENRVNKDIETSNNADIIVSDDDPNNNQSENIHNHEVNNFQEIENTLNISESKIT